MAVRAGVAFIDIQPDWAKFNRQLGRQGASLTRGFGKLGHDLGSELSRGAMLGLKIGAAGVATALIGSVKKAADFESQISSLGAVSDASAKQLERLRKQAIKAGADTKFSALEAAQAQTELAKGGLKTSQILRGGLSAALALAAAGEMDLADAGQTVVNAMKLFGLHGKDSMKIADGLATAANNTTADVSDFALALNQGGSAAKAAGLNFTETVASLESLAEMGIKGSDAGTSLKAALTQLASPTEKSLGLMDKLGLSFFDAQGNMKPLVDISKMLRDRLGGLTREQRLSTATTLVGTDGMRALLALYDAGPQKIGKFEQGLSKQGTAAEVAKKKQDNLKGSLEQLGGSIETLGITVGTGMIPALRQGADELTGFTNQVEKVFERDDLTLGEKLQKSIDIAEIDAKPWVAKLKTAINDAHLSDRLADVVSDATPKMANAAAQAAPKAAGAFAHAFIESSIWGRLLIGAVIFKKMGGFQTWRAAGGQAGSAFATGAATTAGQGLTTRLAGVARTAGKTVIAAAAIEGISEGIKVSKSDLGFASKLRTIIHGASFGLIGSDVSADMQRRFKEIATAIRSNNQVLQFPTMKPIPWDKVINRAGLSEQQRDALRDLATFQAGVNATTRELSAHGITLKINTKDGLEKTTEFLNAIERMESGTSSSLVSLKTNVRLNMRAIGSTLDKDSAAGKEALAANFRAAIDNVQHSMAAGKISVSDGLAYIRKLMRDELALFGITGKEATRYISGQDTKTGKPITGSPGTGKQRGGAILDGDPSGDSVPAMLEKGEYVLNRRAVKTLGRGALDRINFGAAPRFQTGGSVGGLKPAVASLSRQLVQRFGLVISSTTGGQHAANSFHKLGLAADLSGAVDAMKKAAEWLKSSGIYRSLLEGIHNPNLSVKNGAIVPSSFWGAATWADHADHIHIALQQLAAMLGGSASGAPKLGGVTLTGTDSPLKTIAQRAVNTVQAAAQQRLDQVAGSTVEGAEPDAGAATGNGADLMRQIAKQRGWNFADWWALDGSETSHGRNLVNPHSTARLRGQFLKSNWGQYGPGSDPSKNPTVAQQIESFAEYISARYDNPTDAWSFHKAHGWYGLGGPVGMQKGGLAGELSKTLGKTRHAGTRKSRKIGRQAVSALIDKIKAVGLPAQLEQDLQTLSTQADEYGDFADRAGRLTVDPGDGSDPILGVVGGHNQVEWLTEQLTALFKWRNAIIDAEQIVVQRRDETSKLIEKARTRLTDVAHQIRDASELRDRLAKKLEKVRDRIGRLRDNPHRHAGLLAQLRKQAGWLRGQIVGIDHDQKGRTTERDALKDKILPALTGKRSSLNEARGTLLSTLTEVQGVGSPMDRLTTLPPIGALGGRILDAQLQIRDLTTKPPAVTDTSTTSTDTPSERDQILADLLREANQRTAVSEAQFKVFKDFPPFGGSFDTGGVVPGPVGSPRTIIAHGGETVTPPGDGTRVRVEVHDHRTSVFVDDVEQIVEHYTRRQARAGGRLLPGRAGMLQ